MHGRAARDPQPISRLYLPYISPISCLYLAYISPGAPRAILNLPLPYGQAKLAQKQGSLCGVTLPILHAAALRHRTPRALLWVLWCAA